MKDAIPTFGKYFDVLNKTFLKTGFTVIFGLLESPYLGTHLQGYATQLNEIKTHVNRLEELGQELHRFKTNAKPCLCRDEQFIMREVGEVKSRLSNAVTLFNIHASGALKEDICQIFCPSAFSAYTNQINNLFATIMTSIR